MAVVVLFTISGILCILPILHLALPGFERQKRMANLASMLNMTEVEVKRLQENSLVRSLGDQIKKGNWLDRIFGQQRRVNYEALEMSYSYEYYISKVFLQSLVVLPVPIFFALATKQMFFLVMGPVLSGLLFYSGLRKIKLKYQERQNRLIRDLPNLISKMIIALEVGQQLTDIFREVSERCDPLLSKLLKQLIANSNNMPMRSALQIFANEVNLPVMYDFISVVNVIMEKGFHEGEGDLNSIKNDLKELRRLSLIELTKGNPEKMNFFYAMMIGHVIVFLFLTALVMFSALNSI